MRSRSVISALVGCTSLIAVFAIQVPAEAATAVSNAHGSATFEASGDVLGANNMAAGGFNTRARLWRLGEVVHTITDMSNNGSPETQSLNLPENTGYNLQVCSVHLGALSHCSAKVFVTS